MRKILLASTLLTVLSLQGCATSGENLLLGALIGGAIASSASACSRFCY